MVFKKSEKQKKQNFFSLIQIDSILYLYHKKNADEIDLDQ